MSVESENYQRSIRIQTDRQITRLQNELAALSRRILSLEVRCTELEEFRDTYKGTRDSPYVDMSEDLADRHDALDNVYPLDP